MLFSNKYFYILSTQNSKRNQIAEKIEENGGVVVRDELAQLNEDGDAASNANYENALKLTHCVILNDVKESTRINNPTIKTRLQQLNTLREFDLHYVTEHWVQDSIRLKQLQPEKKYRGEVPPLPLSHVTLSIDQNELGDKVERVIVLARYLGAKFVQTLNSECTHLIARTDKNIRKLVQSQHNKALKVVSYKWLNDCAEHSKYVNENNYYLVEPEEEEQQEEEEKVDNESVSIASVSTTSPVQKTPTQKRRANSQLNSQAAVTTTPNVIRTPAPSQTKSIEDMEKEANAKLRTIFREFKFYVSMQDYSQEIRPEIIKTLQGCGATVLLVYSSACTHVMGRYMNSQEMQQAEKDGKTLVSLQWLDDCIRKRKLVDTDQDILYRPLKTNKTIPEFKDWTISVSGFVGAERHDVMYLIRACGAKFSGDFSADHSCLIMPDNTPNDNDQDSGKVSKKGLALSEQIPVVTKQWIQDCARSWEVVPVDSYLLIPDQEYKLPGQVQASESVKQRSLKKQATSSQNNKRSRDNVEEEEDEVPAKKQKRKEKTPDTDATDKRYAFLLSSDISNDAKQFEGFKKKIKNMGATVIEDSTEGKCTHLIIGELKRTEKVLCACAAGAWVLKPDFLHRAFSEKAFPEEDAFEFKDNFNYSSTGKPIPNPREWRQYIARNKRPFEDMKVLILQTEQFPPISVLNNVLQSGGASEVIIKKFFSDEGSKKKLQVKKLTDDELDGMDFVIVNADSKTNLKHKDLAALLQQVRKQKLKTVKGQYVLDRITFPPYNKPDIKDYIVG